MFYTYEIIIVMKEVFMFGFLIKEENLTKSTFMFTVLIILISLSATVVFSILFFSSIHIESILSSILVPGVIFPVLLYYLFRSQVKIDKLDQKLFINSRKDLQTDTWNRRYFLELAEREFFVAKRYEDKFSVLICDIDDFKAINEKHGHLIGDKVLRTLAQTLAHTIRHTDTIARYDGKRFAILLPKINLENGKLTALRLKKLIEDSSVSIPDEELKYTISIGVAEYNEETLNISDLLTKAENALDEAKKKGPSSVEVA